ncbi:MAG: hypothetical protein VX644_03750 [Planctomycetota bacterium]|nr:hypothetical protein [Planctomycetota bacterium]
MSWDNLVWGAPNWLPVVAILGAISIILVIWNYRQSTNRRGFRFLAGMLKLTSIAALLFCLLEPLFSGVRPRPGANLFIILADDSQSLQVHDNDQKQSRGEKLKEVLQSDRAWQVRLQQDFNVRNYSFGNQLDATSDFTTLDFQGNRSAMITSLRQITDRFRERNLAGILLFSDGNGTDITNELADWTPSIPIYPVVSGTDHPAHDLRAQLTSVRQTNFEQAPITIHGEVKSYGWEGERIVTEVLNGNDEVLEELETTALADGQPQEVRFKLSPQEAKLDFYRLRVRQAGSDAENATTTSTKLEATLANNERLVAIDRGGGPYRILYLSGRPNWEFKFLRRSLQEDNEVELLGLIRIARREPKFDFRSRFGETTNPLFRGFGNQDDETAEQYDQPVLLRMGTKDAEELRDGFPKNADELFRYHAIIVDDLEAGFFTTEQLSLLLEFVRHRGGGFLMLGGQESFIKGGYQKTLLNDLMPVYLERQNSPPEEEAAYQLLLTREGWLEPWIRIRPTEEAERKRLSTMPAFQTINPVRGHKPGSVVLMRAVNQQGQELPALVARSYGEGRSAALLVGDLWRWSLQRATPEEDDLAKAWRQTLRWLVADVPQRIEVESREQQGTGTWGHDIVVKVKDKEYYPLDNASVEITVTQPDQTVINLTAEPSNERAGEYHKNFVPRQSGAYRVVATVTAPDGSRLGTRESGWVSEPAADEFRELEPNRKTLDELAKRSGGEVLTPADLDRFVKTLPNRKVPVTEPWVYPLWHRTWLFVFAMLCLCGEWGIRRWKGLP